MKKNILNILCLISLFQFSMNGQTLKAFIQAADEAMASENYYAALNYYKNALEFNENDLDVQYKYAQSAKDFNAYTLAETEYMKVLEMDSVYKYPIATYELAQVQQQLGKYQDAKRNYELFLSEYTGDDEAMSKAIVNEVEACMWAMDQQDLVGPTANIERLGEDINTPFSEFGAQQFAEDLYYSSLRFDNAQDQFDPARNYAKILKAIESNGGEVLDNGGINDSNKHVAHSSITPDGKLIFYTICDYLTAYDIRCDLYYRPIDDEGNFGTPMMLPNYINNPSYTSTQPHASIDAETGEVIIYFASDRPLPDGSNNGLDIYRTTLRDGGTFTEPENIKSLNTTGDEITPFFHQASNTVYFSSNSGFRFGGYDVFKSKANGSQFQERVNLGNSINTSYNDIYYTLSDDGQNAYFSSNRLGSAFLDDQAEACCYDIYKASIEALIIKLNALTFIKKNLQELDNTTVSLYDAITGDLLEQVTPQGSNEHLFDIESGREYMLVASKDGYVSDTVTFTTFDVTDSLLIKKLFLESKCIELDLSTFDQGTGSPLTGVEILVEDLTYPGNPIKRYDPASNNYKLCLEKDREYKITATKPGYESSSILVDTRVSPTPEKIERKIYLSKKIADLSSMLPVVLYFDNDEPDNRSYRLYTLKNYTDTYYPYISRKEEFKTNYAQPLSASAKEQAASNLESFFELDVKGGYTQLQTFLNALVGRLQAGESFEIQIKGYASPRASNKYNLALGQRRVFAIKNELRDYVGGALSQYLDNGQLKIKDVSFGEELAPKSISDDYNNTRESIYSVEASRERKATIVDLIKLN